MTDPSAMYTAEWYTQEYDDGLQWPAVEQASLALVALLRPKRVLDVGCGPGFMVDALRELGVEAYGFDGSVHAVSRARSGFVWLQDLREPIDFTPANVDLVVCTEVAEHMAPEHADRLVNNLCRPGPHSHTIVFTAAPPGQGGLGHVNEQPKAYWVEKFEARGYAVNPTLTGALAIAWQPIARLSHLHKNVMVLQ